MFSNITFFTSETWTLTFISLSTSSKWSIIYLMCSFMTGLWQRNQPHCNRWRQKMISPPNSNLIRIPEFFIKTLCCCCISFATSISFYKICFQSLQESNRDISSNGVFGNNAIGCTSRSENRHLYLKYLHIHLLTKYGPSRGSPIELKMPEHFRRNLFVLKHI